MSGGVLWSLVAIFTTGRICYRVGYKRAEFHRDLAAARRVQREQR